MGINLNGTTLGSSAGLVVSAAVGQVQKLGPTGTLQRYNLGQPMFRAGGSGTAAGVNIGAVNTWVPMVFNATNVNVGACYNTANGRFTVPVTGIYLLAAHTYGTGGSPLGWHVHSMFYVNGSQTARRPSGGLHRLHGHGAEAGHSFDTRATEIISLIAGDYVQFYNHPGSYVSTWIPQYSRFEGYLLS